MAIGSPGEDVGTVKDAGSVTLVIFKAGNGLTLKQCPAQVFTQGHGMPGKAEAGDEVGAAMGEASGDPDLDEDRMDGVLTGVPGEDIGTVKDAGLVIRGTGSRATTAGYQGGAIGGMRYGSVLPALDVSP
jgi:hypothetical protein